MHRWTPEFLASGIPRLSGVKKQRGSNIFHYSDVKKPLSKLGTLLKLTQLLSTPFLNMKLSELLKNVVDPCSLAVVEGFGPPESIVRVPEMSTKEFFDAQRKEAKESIADDEWYYYSGFIPEQATEVQHAPYQQYAVPF